MREVFSFFFCCVVLLTGVAVAQNDQPTVLSVWPNETVGDLGDIGPERIRALHEAPTPDAKWITNVTHPTITVFRPEEDRNLGAAVVICPGGGYWNLAWDLEGEEVAAWFNSIGITGVVLKYRVPRRPGQLEPLPAPGPLLDAQRAMRLVRHHAPSWSVDPGRVGIVGFSAGGHLSVATATNFDQPAYDPIDEIDKLSCRPDFAVAVYPGYLIPQPETGEKLASYIRIPPQTPPIFLVHADDDRVAGPENSLLMYAALKRAGVSSELHIFSRGGHGFGVRKTSHPTVTWPASTWTDRCEEWLRALRVIPADNDLTPDFSSMETLPQGDVGIASRYLGDQGIEKDPAVLFHDDFESDDLKSKWDMVYHDSNIRIATESENTFRGTRALEFKIPRQNREVSNEVVKRLDAGYDVIFLRYYSKFDEGFDQTGSSHNGGFLGAIAEGVDFATPGIRSNGTNKFIASYENWRESSSVRSPGELNVYCYHMRQRSQWGDHFFPSGKVLPNSSQAGDFGSQFVSRQDITQELGRWYCYEFMLCTNGVGQSDGRIACWLDGRLIADFRNLQFRTTESLKINFAALNLHIGGNRSRDNKKWYDDIVVATSYIGPQATSQ